MAVRRRFDGGPLEVWGGLQASVPIALVLGLPPATPFRAELRAMVFGVAAFGLDAEVDRDGDEPNS